MNKPPIKVSSQLVAIPCWYCGFTPVQLRTELDSGRIQFTFTCRNTETCEMGWRSPKNEMWQPSKRGAADKWNEDNKK